MVDYAAVDAYGRGGSAYDGKHNAAFDQNPFTKGERCAVYDPAAPAGRKFRYYETSRKKAVDNRTDIVAQLNEIKLDSIKNPVVKLNEIAIKMKKTIKYDMISLSGAMHTPIFTIRALVGDIVAYGNGPSKKDAKKNAAIELLKVIDFSKDNNLIKSTTSNEPLVNKVLETKSELNPIGVLQELCMAYQWQLPTYEYLKEISHESNEVKFVVICSLNVFRSKGVSLTKQGAKRQAASLLYDQIKNLSLEDISAPHNCVKYTEPSEILLNNNQFDNKKSIIDEKCNLVDGMKCVEVFIKNLKSSTNPSINQLKVLDISYKPMSAVDFLDKIGKEEGFTSTYIKLNNASSHEKILVQVSFFPLVINLGIGNTLEEAQESAAFAVLSYFKILLKDCSE